MKSSFKFIHGRKYLAYTFTVCVILITLVTCSRINKAQEAITIIPDIRIIDGDTIKINDRKIRLYGMDAPEMKQKCYRNQRSWQCGEAAREKLVSIIGNGKDLTCDKKYFDLYKREVAICYVEGKDISQLMVREGMAVAYRQYSKKYVSDEEYAKTNKLGIWDSKFIEPRIYRINNKKKK